MPYPRAYIYFSAVLAAAILAFTPSYFGNLRAASPAHHFHAAVAGAWLVLLIGQSWAIHHRRISLHRAMGKSSYVLAPLFLAAGFAIIQAMHSGGGPFREMFGSSLAFSDFVAMIVFAGLYYAAITNRRDVRIHARCMSATVLLLISPVVARILSFYVPGFLIPSPAELGSFPVNFHLGNLVALLPALVLLYRERRIMGWRSPYLVVVIGIGVQSLGFELLGDAAWWQGLLDLYGNIPASIVITSGVLAGAAVVIAAMKRNQPTKHARPA